MSFRTKIDYSNNRQITQRVETDTQLSGATTFGVGYSALTRGVDLSTTGITETTTGVTSTFSGTTGTTVFVFGDDRMELAGTDLIPISNINSGTTQNAGATFTGDTSTTVDANLVYLSYTGISYNLDVSTIIEISPGVFTGTTTSDVLIYSGDTADYTGTTVWATSEDSARVKGILYANILNVNSITGAGATGFTNTVTTGATLNGNVIEFNRSDLDNAYDVDLTPILSGSTTLWSGSTGTNSLVPSNQTDNIAYGTAGLAGGEYSISSGITSFAYGYQANATNHYSTAFGNTSIASGIGSLTAGGLVFATGEYSQAFGSSNVASGNNAAVFGSQATASGNLSFAAGSSVSATGQASAAFGGFTFATGFNSFTIGNGNNGIGDRSFAGGSQSSATGATSFIHSTQSTTNADMSAILAGSGNTLSVTAIGSAIIGGYDISGTTANTTYVPNLNIGIIGTGTSVNNLAVDVNGNVVEGGTFLWASGTGLNGSTVQDTGFSNVASGDAAIAMGGLTISSGFFSLTQGQSTVASGTSSHAEGIATIAGGSASHSEGSGTVASGTNSHAEGQLTLASGDESHAEGNSTTANGEGSHSEGLNTTATGQHSHAEGNGSESIGVFSHAEGLNTTATGFWSHSEGNSTNAFGQTSHAGGFNTTSSGTTSFIHSSQSHVNGENSAILGGIDNLLTIDATNSVILGSTGITGTTASTVYVPNLNIGIVGTGTSVNSLGIDVNGNVVAGSGGDTYATGTTFINNELVITNSTGGTFGTTIENFTGVTVSGIMSATTITAVDNFTYTKSGFGEGKVLMSDENGNASWQTPANLASAYYYLINDASDVGGYLIQQPELSTRTTGNTVSNSGVVDGDLLASFATPIGDPNLTEIPEGFINLHIHAVKTAGGINRDTTLYFEVYSRTTGGTETLIGTSANSGVVQDIEGEISTDLPISGATLNISDRIITKIYATVVGTGAAPTIDLILEDGTASRITLPNEVFNATNYVPYTGATKDLDLGSFNIDATNINATGGIYSGGTNLLDIFSTDSVPNPAIREATTSGNILSTDWTVFVTSSGDTTQTLPTAIGVAGKVFNVKNLDSTSSGVVTVNTSLTQTIDIINTSIIINYPNGLTFQSTGSGWIII